MRRRKEREGGASIRQIGIPRALYYFHYHTLWRHFLEELDFDVVVSPPTNKHILELGVTNCVDGACLAVKSYVGHCLALASQGVRLLFVPQIVSVSDREYTCANFLGLPDLLRQYLPGSTELLTPVFDGRRGERGLMKGYLKLGLPFATSPTVKRALYRSAAAQRSVEQETQRDFVSADKMKVLVLGPRYVVDDPFLSGSVCRHLEALGAEVCTVTQVPEHLATKPNSTGTPNKRLFWSGARHSMDALEYFVRDIDGVVNLSPFGCGAESMVSVLIQQRLKGGQVALLDLNIDEHTGEIGMLTRLEAFCDLLERKIRG